MQLFRLLSAQPEADGEYIKIKGAAHNDDWYEDAYGQNPAPFYRNPFLEAPQRPPYPWRPFNGLWPATASLGPVFPSLAVQVNTAVSPTALQLSGWVPVNAPPAGNAPLVPLQGTTASTGGNIPPGTWLIAIGGGNTDAIPVSSLVTVVVPSGTNTNTITVSPVTWTGAVSVIKTWIGPDSQHMRWGGLTVSATGSDAFGNPTSFTFSTVPSDGFGLPDINFNSFLFIARDIVHGGVWGDAITGIGTGTLTFADASWTTNQWAGYTISLYYAPGTTGPQPGLDYKVASNTSNTLTLTSGHTLVIGDVVVARFKPGSITANTIGDANCVNSYAPSGLTVNVEAGNLIYIVAGTGAGQPPATIKSNTSTVFTIYRSWYVTPDSTSIFIVVRPATRYQVETGTVYNDGAGSQVSAAGTILATNPVGLSLLIEAITIDANGNWSIERYAPIRELYVPPQASTALNPGYVPLAPSSGAVTPDLSLGLNFGVTLTAGSALTVSLPIYTGGAIVSGMSFSLYLFQPSGGGAALPTFAGGVGGFVSNTGSQITIDGTQLTETALVFTFKNGYWSLDSWQTGKTTS